MQISMWPSESLCVPIVLGSIQGSKYSSDGGYLRAGVVIFAHNWPSATLAYGRKSPSLLFSEGYFTELGG